MFISDSLMMAFWNAETCSSILSTNTLNEWCICWSFTHHKKMRGPNWKKLHILPWRSLQSKCHMVSCNTCKYNFHYAHTNSKAFFVYIFTKLINATYYYYVEISYTDFTQIRQLTWTVRSEINLFSLSKVRISLVWFLRTSQTFNKRLLIFPVQDVKHI
jgi:hypothetical protein